MHSVSAKMGSYTYQVMMSILGRLRFEGAEIEELAKLHYIDDKRPTSITHGPIRLTDA